jgi:hypothetical protein
MRLGLVKNLLSYHWLRLYQQLGVYQQLDSLVLQLARILHEASYCERR